jgi:tRNA (adenine57-N1/adenine58-N1)-methyltransferase
MMETSPFFTPGTRTKNNTLALLSLGRDQLPVLLRAPAPPPQPGAAPATAGAAGGPAGPAPDAITNTRFGSYPHSTLVEVPWGAQVSASNVGAAERRRGKRRKLGGGGDGGGGEQKKKKKKKGAAPEGGVNGVADDGGEDEDRDDGDGDAADEAQPATNGGFVAASSGFAHLAVPTPESWTGVLQHRTQVVYIPDCAYILHLLRARPGCRLIECGAGSGSFTHAAARAVFSGYPPEPETPAGGAPSGRRSEFGKVFSFEYHEQRFKFLRREIAEHGLSRVVRVTHRDVYERGFALDDEPVSADAVFLDLPAPWSVASLPCPFPR